jgi:chemotaxis signal transduction protein
MLRGKSLPAVDLRRAVQLTGAREELAALLVGLGQRKQEHVNWVNELTSCVESGRTFGLATDPTKCAFGRWFASFAPPDPVIRLKLLTIDQPHRRIHAVANRALTAAAEGRRDDARRLVDSVRDNDLEAVKVTLDEVSLLLRDSLQEVLVVCERGGSSFGVIVDGVREVRSFDAVAVGSLDGAALGSHASTLCVGAARLDDELAILLDLAQIAQHALGTSNPGARVS